MAQDKRTRNFNNLLQDYSQRKKVVIRYVVENQLCISHMHTLLVIVLCPLICTIVHSGVIAYCKFNTAPHGGNTVQLVLLLFRPLK